MRHVVEEQDAWRMEAALSTAYVDRTAWRRTRSVVRRLCSPGGLAEIVGCRAFRAPGPTARAGQWSPTGDHQRLPTAHSWRVRVGARPLSGSSSARRWRDEGLAYAQRLREAGVGVTAYHYAAMAHPFLSFVNAFELSNEAVERVAERIRATDAAPS